VPLSAGGRILAAPGVARASCEQLTSSPGAAAGWGAGRRACLFQGAVEGLCEREFARWLSSGPARANKHRTTAVAFSLVARPALWEKVKTGCWIQHSILHLTVTD